MVLSGEVFIPLGNHGFGSKFYNKTCIKNTIPYKRMRKEQNNLILTHGKNLFLVEPFSPSTLRKSKSKSKKKFHEFECYNQLADKVWEHRLKS